MPVRVDVDDSLRTHQRLRGALLRPRVSRGLDVVQSGAKALNIGQRGITLRGNYVDPTGPCVYEVCVRSGAQPVDLGE
jgi:hypothetical protein